MNTVRPPSPSAPPAPPTAAAPEAPRGRTSLSAADLAALRPHVVTLEDGRLADGGRTEPRSVEEFRTTTGDIEAIFEEHLPAFVAAHAPRPPPGGRFGGPAGGGRGYFGVLCQTVPSSYSTR